MERKPERMRMVWVVGVGSDRATRCRRDRKDSMRSSGRWHSTVWRSVVPAARQERMERSCGRRPRRRLHRADTGKAARLRGTAGPWSDPLRSQAVAAGPSQPPRESSSYNHHQMESSIVFGDQSDRAWQRELSAATGLAAQPVGRRYGPERGAASRPCALPCHLLTPCTDACRCSHPWPCQPRNNQHCCQHTIAGILLLLPARPARVLASIYI